MISSASIPVPELDLEVEALIAIPDGATGGYVFAHGAGAGMEHTFMQAVSWARERFPDVPLFAGGKSLGGRMTSRWAATADPLPERLRGLVFFGFPLHPPNKPGVERAAHLAQVSLPMLFLSGDRDSLADLALLRPVVQDLGPAATLQVVEAADHGFRVLKRSGRSEDEVLDEIATTAADWMLQLG